MQGVGALLLDGAGLRGVFAWQNPFRPAAEGPGGARSGRVTILAANASFPLDVELKAFCRAAAEPPGSPLIIQYSYNSLCLLGGRTAHLPAQAGAFHAALVLDHYVEESGARYVAVALDHFRVPPYPGPGGQAGSLARRTARAAVDDALEASRAVLGKVPDRELESYVTYLSSPAYAEFRREFGAVLSALGPAWAMIDTERLPPVLDFALTRDMIDFVRKDLGLIETMVEAEYGATGSAGESLDYVPLRGEALERFADEVACFVTYTGADAVSYPIGMGHGAPRAQRHDPDSERLEAVQSRLLRAAGRYVPFCQHGGTGAARLALGLVGKNNVNTHFLVAGADALADKVLAELDRIRAGAKDACGPGLYGAAVEAIQAAAVDKLKEARTYGTGPALAEFLSNHHPDVT